MFSCDLNINSLLIHNLLCFVILICSYQLGNSQILVGLEAKGGVFYNYNLGAFEGGFSGLAYDVIDERNTWTKSYSVGLFFTFRDHQLKFGLGRHENGRVFDLVRSDDIFGPGILFSDINLPYKYTQYIISYSYVIPVTTILTIPLEIGVCRNDSHWENVFYGNPNPINYDLRLGIGAQFLLTDNESLGVKTVIHRYLNEYQYELFVSGEYKPVQWGIEIYFQQRLLEFF